MFRHAIVLVLLCSAAVATPASAREPHPIAIAIHGGAGTILRTSMTPEKEQEYRSKLADALKAGWQILKSGGSSTDAVEASIRVMEDSPLFNAGRGAVFTHDGRNELDAAIMEGRGRRAGAVAGVTIIRNPIAAARAVMEKSPHVMLTGRGAELFATQAGVEIVDPSYFWTEGRWRGLKDALEAEKKASVSDMPQLQDEKFGTVGAVALDSTGNLAAGTSTGGMTNKRFGRIGDAPIIGAGTFADNRSCAVSATGHGEFFIRFTVASEIAARVRYGRLPLAEAADSVVQELKAIGGDGGVIALDATGKIAQPFNTAGMYRGWIGTDGVPHVAIYADEK